MLQITCQICFESFPAASLRSCGCPHAFCLGCWDGYVTNAVSDGPASLDLRCPVPKCNAAVSGGCMGPPTSLDLRCPVPKCNAAVSGGCKGPSICAALSPSAIQR